MEEDEIVAIKFLENACTDDCVNKEFVVKPILNVIKELKKENKLLKHRLVSYVMNYDKRYLVKYTGLIYNEMCKRNIKCRDCYWIEMIRFCGFEEYYMSGMYTEHNDRYLKQCYYNLQEKADRGIINTEEWEKIEEWKKSKNI